MEDSGFNLYTDLICVDSNQLIIKLTCSRNVSPIFKLYLITEATSVQK